MNGERLEGVRVLRLGDTLRLGTTELAVTDADGHIPEPTQVASPAVTHVPIPEELVVVEGLAKGKRLTLDEEMVIGRAESGEGRLGDDPELSRQARPRVPRGGSDRGRGPRVRQRDLRQRCAPERATDPRAG